MSLKFDREITHTHSFCSLYLSKEAFEEIKSELTKTEMLKEYFDASDNTIILPHFVLLQKPECDNELYNCLTCEHLFKRNKIQGIFCPCDSCATCPNCRVVNRNEE